MTSHLSPAAQFAAAAAAEAEAEAVALAESVSAAAIVDSAPADEGLPVPYLAICPAAPPGYVPPEFTDEATAPVVDCVDATAATASAVDENVARQVSSAAV
ncbi:hypothetical protein GGI06_002972, partial [Coemansia sp. S85]